MSDHPVSAAALAVTSFLDELPPICDVLRDYQREQIAAIAQAIRAGHARIVVQSPTGSGKTHEIASSVAAAVQAGLSVLILATRTRVVRQIHERLEAFGVAHGVIAAELRGMLDQFQSVQVASVDTLYRRCLGEGHMPLPRAAVVIFDEAHLAVADSRLKIIDQYHGALLLGFTATPARRSGRALCALFDHLIRGLSIAQLIAAGMLVRPRIFCAPVVTEKELAALPKDTSNDFAPNAMAVLMSRPKLVGDVLTNWLRIAPGKRTLIFACGKAHGAQLLEQFSRAGVSAELLTDEDDEESREATIARLESRETTIVINCFLLSYGVDLPSIECIVIARPTRSLVLYLQTVGRGLRPSPGKECCILIDHGRVVQTLGLPTLDFAWSLDDTRNVNREALEAAARKSAQEGPRTCPDCRYTWLVSEGGPACENCGWQPAPRAIPVRTQEADLRELGVLSADVVSPGAPPVMEFFREALHWYAHRWPKRWQEKPKSGRWWAWIRTRERFDISEATRMPSRYWELDPTPPTKESAGWIHSRHIRDLKSRAWGSP
jgi:DNA repair protein RadD